MAGPFSPADTRHYVSVGKQTVKGTGVAPTFSLAFMGGQTFDHGVDFQEKREAAAGALVARTVKGLYKPNGRAVTAVRSSTPGKLWAYLLGVDTISGAADPWTHTIKHDTSVDWVSIERGYGDEQIERIIDSVITSITLDVAKRDSDAEPRMEIAYLGLQPQRQAAITTPTYEALAPMIRSECVWTIDGAAATNVESCKVTVGWSYDEAMLADLVYRADAMKINLSIDVELTQLYNTAAETDAYRKTHYGTTTGTAVSETVNVGALILTMTKAGITPARVVTLTLPEIDWWDAKLTELDPSGTQASRVVRSGRVRKPAAGEGITIAFQNADSVAYV